MFSHQIGNSDVYLPHLLDVGGVLVSHFNSVSFGNACPHIAFRSDDEN